MRTWFLLVLPIFCNSIFGQVTEELTYPVVPIADECHQILDISDSIIVMSKEAFLKMDSLWTTFNTCYNYTDDTLWIKQFEIVFAGIMNDGKSSFLVSDGNLKNEYLSSLLDARKHIEPFDHIHIKNVQFEQYGGMYQVDDLHVVIDSLVVPRLDTCWQYFPVAPTGERKHISITKNIFTNYLNDSFGYNTCAKKQAWPDTTMKVEMWIAPRSLVGHYTVNSFINDYKINNRSDLSRPLKEISSLKYGDIIAFRRAHYLKDNKYYYTPEYRFHINDREECSTSFNVEIQDTVSLAKHFEAIRKDKFKGALCFENAEGKPINFQLVLVPENGVVAMLSSSGGTFTAQMINQLKTLKSGDRVILEGLNADDPYKNKKSNYKSIAITLP
jgi:hypothetical protein